jgi:2-polyprenyl-3-methyl-5-hydroxy-6-metoxy-1,4-benzoquinol methylase
MQAESTSCPICGSSSRYDFSGRNVLLGTDMNRYDYYKCDVCRVLFLHPMPDPQALANLYPDDYVEADDLHRQKTFNPLKLAQLKLHHGYTHLQTNPLAELLAWIVRPFLRADRSLDFSPDGKLLDVGCGNGRFLRSMRTLGWQVQGVEFNGKSVEFCRNTGLDVHGGDLVSARFPAESFDVITVRHVIEHIPTPQEFMTELARILKPGGCLVIETPNFSSLGWALFGTRWYAAGIPYHLMLFSQGNLAILAGKHGLVPLHACLETSQKLFLNSLDMLFERQGRPSRKIKWRRFLGRLFVWIAQREGRGDIIHSTFRRPG